MGQKRSLRGGRENGVACCNDIEWGKLMQGNVKSSS